jgi:cellulose biosynthesis protein BcsQ
MPPVTLATYNIKGGVGKTSTAVNLAALAAAGGRRTLLWDLDPQGAATFLFRIRPKVKGGGRRLVRGRSDPDSLIRGTDHEGLDLLPADFSYRHMDLFLDASKHPERRLGRVLAPVAAGYDLVILDCPPSISLVSENVFLAADALLVPLIPTTLSLRTLDQLAEFVGTTQYDHLVVLPFFSMVDRRKALHREITATLAERFPHLLSTAIPASTDVERMGLHREPVVVSAPRSRVSDAYRSLWSEVESRLDAIEAARTPRSRAAAGAPRR